MPTDATRNPRLRAAPFQASVLALFVGFGIGGFSRPSTARNFELPIQLVWARQYYTLFLAKSRSGQGPLQPYVRCAVYLQFRNWGPSQRVPMAHGERPEYPNIRFRVWRNQVPIPFERRAFPGLGAQDSYTIHFDEGESVRVTYEYIEQVVRHDPERKVDVFEDTWGFLGYQPPLEDWWIVVDLGQMYTQYQASPGFGESPGTPALPYQSFFNRVFQVAPLGYRSRGTEIWWRFQDVGEERMHSFPKLRVEWQAWYR
ncbi:hypothetical protein [Methylacidimicrobium sp. B4]|uniref:hypothetical protein n=1 Tax=Methylacidimicrobium sp. B4 TaxID=2796139 RepID=UPI001A8C832F|nr:hypothetical protein [Methylacidimicrobium sp. B4]QSR85635.1 hypothetical protein MacB4_05295 [Methylacidimicrobium sp. B4]